MGILVYKFWRNKNVYARTGILLGFTLLLGLLVHIYKTPVFTIGFVWLSILFAGTFIRMLYNLIGGKWKFSYLEMCWAVFQTFVFVTFTRLFFRAGSNLNPDEANEAAWNTAKNMVNQIGGKWDFSLIGDMAYEYRGIFSLIMIGMLIHWLPDNWKRRYRIIFAKIPLIPMALIIVAAVFVIYQFISADLQRFIYFQF